MGGTLDSCTLAACCMLCASWALHYSSGHCEEERAGKIRGRAGGRAGGQAGGRACERADADRDLLLRLSDGAADAGDDDDHAVGQRAEHREDLPARRSEQWAGGSENGTDGTVRVVQDTQHGTRRLTARCRQTTGPGPGPLFATRRRDLRNI